MKILGHTEEGDLIVQVSKVEWDELQGGVKPKENDWYSTEAAKLFRGKSGNVKRRLGEKILKNAFYKGEFDGSIESLRDVADGGVVIDNLGKTICKNLQWLLEGKL